MKYAKQYESKFSESIVQCKMKYKKAKKEYNKIN